MGTWLETSDSPRNSSPLFPARSLVLELVSFQLFTENLEGDDDGEGVEDECNEGDRLGTSDGAGYRDAGPTEFLFELDDSVQFRVRWALLLVSGEQELH